MSFTRSTDADAKYRVYVYGYYGCGNVGDELLLQVVLQHLLDIAEIESITVKCLAAPDGFSDTRVSYDVCEQLMLQLGRARSVRLLAFLRRLWRSLRGIDCLIFGGGTLFHADKGSPRNLLVMTAVAVLARLRGARVCALGVGVGRIDGWIPKLLMSLILLLSSDFAVRDKTSLENCRSLLWGAKARLTADMVFCLEIPQTAGARSAKRIGFTMAASALREADHISNKGLGELKAGLAVLSEKGWRLDGIVFQHLEAHGMRISDNDIFDAILPVCRKSNGQRFQPSANAPGIAELFGGFDVVVGMRFHSLVLAAMCGIPFVGVGDDHKLRDICSSYGMPYLALSCLKATDLVSAVNLAHGLRPVKTVSDSLSRLAAQNFGQLENCLS